MIKRKNNTITFKCLVKNAVHDVMTKRNSWKESETEEGWDIMWADKNWVTSDFDGIRFRDNQKVNHFRNFYELTRKDLLIKNVNKIKIQYRRSNEPNKLREYSFCPVSYTLPAEYSMFVEEFKKEKGLWIMKPVGKSQGKGIFIITKPSDISEWKKGYEEGSDAYLVQKYIQNPYLIGGKKFDMRIYCLVTSYTPLQVWLYRSGFCRFTNSRYSSDPKDIENIYIHLTNVSIQKHTDDYDNNNNHSKWGLKSLRIYLLTKIGKERTEMLFSDIQSVILKSLFSVENVMIQDKHCFELYGYDILFDDTLTPWLLEVNAMPSMVISSESDKQMKTALLEDVFNIIDLENQRSGDELQIGGFDLIWNNGAIDELSVDGYYKSYLGCVNQSIDEDISI